VSAGTLNRFAVLLLAIGSLLVGCAEKGPVLLSASYLTTDRTEVRKGTPAAIAVNTLRDERGKPVSVLGKRTIPSGQADELVVQPTVAFMATAVLKQSIAARGHVVKDVDGWDLTVEGMHVYGAPIVIGGEIKTLWMESTPSSLNTHVSASVQLRMVAGDAAEKKIIRVIDVRSKVDQDILYSRERLQAVLSEAVSSAIDQLLNDDEIKKRLQ
jgi:uncharacterized lipoprotein YajG